MEAIQGKKRKKQFRTAEEKRHHYEAWKSSGLSRSVYCKQAGLANSVFCKWVKDIEDCGSMGFVEVPLKESMAVQSAVQSLEIKLLNGLQCRFNAFSDIALLVKLVQALNHVAGH